MKKPFIAVLNLNRIGISILMRYAKEHTVLGFDLSKKRIEQLSIKMEQLQRNASQDPGKQNRILFSHAAKDLRHCKMYWIVVPTKELPPDSRQLKAVKRYTALVGNSLKPGDWVFFTSGPNDRFIIDTCMPLLEEVSGMKERKEYTVAFTGVPKNDQKHISF